MRIIFEHFRGLDITENDVMLLTFVSTDARVEETSSMPEGLKLAPSIIRVNWIISGTIIRRCVIPQAVTVLILTSHHILAPSTSSIPIEKSRIEINFTQKSTFYS